MHDFSIGLFGPRIKKGDPETAFFSIE